MTLQVRNTGCLTQRCKSEVQNPSGLWVYLFLGSRQRCAGDTTPTMTPTSSSLEPTGDSVPMKTGWSRCTRAACRTGVEFPMMWTLPSGTSMVSCKTQTQVQSMLILSCQQEIIRDVSLVFSGYAHFILGRQYWKFDPVGRNSLEGYPRYVGMDFFGCRMI